MQNNYRGMTVNERLYESGRVEEFDKAIKDKDEGQIRKILEELEVDKPSIDAIVGKSFGKPSEQDDSKKPLRRSIRYPLIVLLAAIGFIGVLVILYDRNYITLIGPFVAIVVASVIGFFIKWRRS